MNTSCFLYPLKATCIETSWYFGDIEVDKLKLWYEQWSKAGAGPNFRVDNPEQYVQKLNWFTNWIDMYFFNKVSDFLIGIIALLLITYFIINLRQSSNNTLNSFSVLIILSLLFTEWFINHPSLRYGGYVIIASVFFIIFLFFFNKVGNKNRIIILIVLFFFVGLTRNIHRISKEVKQYDYNILESAFYLTDEFSYRINNRIKAINQNYNDCTTEKKLCIDNIILKRKNGINIYIKK